MLKEWFAGVTFAAGMIVAGLTEQKIVPPEVANPIVPPQVSQSENEDATKGEGQDYDTPTWCQELRDLPAYEYTYQGATIFVPAGVTLWEEIVEEGHKGPERENICKIHVEEFNLHNEE